MELLCELGMLTGEALSHHEHRELTAGDSQAEIFRRDVYPQL